MHSSSELRYIELKKELITSKTITDLNNLLPQLSSKAKILTKEWLEYIFDSGTRLFVALDGDTVVGTTLLCPMVILVGQKDWIEDVVVDEGYRGRGIASQLLAMAEAESAHGPAKSINLTSSSSRGSAREMYIKRGYTQRDSSLFRHTF